MVLSMERWIGKTAIVTGASSGIGAALAERLVDEGLNVVAVARRKDQLDELAKKLDGRKGKLHQFVADVTKESDIAAVFEYIKENLGPVHVVINNAGFCPTSTWIDGDSAEWRQTLEVNVLGVSLVTREALRDMKQNSTKGHIININSLLGHEVIYFPNSMYTPSKHALTAMTNMLRQELQHMKLQIRVTSISPGLVATEIVEPFKKFEQIRKILEEQVILSTEDICDGVIYALSTPPHVQVNEVTIRPIGRNDTLNLKM